MAYKYTFNGHTSVIAEDLSEALTIIEDWDAIGTMVREDYTSPFPTHPSWVAPSDFDVCHIPEEFENLSYCNDETPCYGLELTHPNGSSEVVIYLSLGWKGREDFESYGVWVNVDGEQQGDVVYYGKNFAEACEKAATLREILTASIGA